MMTVLERLQVQYECISHNILKSSSFPVGSVLAVFSDIVYKLGRPESDG